MGFAQKATPVPKWLIGEWGGTGYQLDGQTWPVQLKATNEGIMVNYPELGCLGNWVLTKRLGPDKMEYSEQIRSGPCDDAVRVVVQEVQPDLLVVSYFLTIDGAEVLAAGVHLSTLSPQSRLFQHAY
jgi:hypothetical protein